MASAAPPRSAAAPATGRSSGGRRPGWVLRLIGSILLTAAFIVGAYILWLLWGTGFYHSGQQDRLLDQFRARVEGTDPKYRPGVVLPGQAYALLRIPSIEVHEVVVEGTAVEDLKRGPGHYAGTADPWDQRGRVAIAGHRTTYGAPFWDLDQVRSGDGIRLITEEGTFDYVVTATREVLPTEGSVLRPSARPTLVLTTCTPRFSAARRLIVFADRVGGPAEAAA